MKITFNELRRLKDSLPDGTIHKITEDLDLTVETVRNYFVALTTTMVKPWV